LQSKTYIFKVTGILLNKEKQPVLPNYSMRALVFLDSWEDNGKLLEVLMLG
jgi:hypothetical protein